MKKEFKDLIDTLKQNNQDFDFYPTTQEIKNAVFNDIDNITENPKDHIKNRALSYRFGESTGYRTYNNDREYVVKLDSFIDICAGNGFMLTDYPKNVVVKNSHAIEKSRILSNILIDKNIIVDGSDLYETVLLTKKYNVAYCNPPYSDYKNVVTYLCEQLTADILYLLIPNRWSSDDQLNKLMHSKGELTVLSNHTFDISDDAQRPARVNVDLIRIVCINRGSDNFEKWFDSNIGEFKESEKIDLEFAEPEKSKDVRIENQDSLTHLVDCYNEDLTKLLEHFTDLGKIPFEVLDALDIKKSNVMKKLQDSITELKHKYWLKSFNTLNEIKTRLTFDSRIDLMNSVSFIKESDFNVNNIRSLITYLTKHHNEYAQKQLEKLFLDLTNMDKGAKAYKSNEKWFNSGWRYTKETPEKYLLDYRIVVPFRKGRHSSSSQYHNDGNSIVSDLCVIANNFGYKTTEIETDKDAETGTAYQVKDINDELIFEYRKYQNGNIHFKINQDLMLKINVEIGKLKGWLNSSQDIENEFEVPESKAKELLNTSNCGIISNNNNLLLNKL